MAAEPLRRRFTVTDFHSMVAAGILSENDRTELIDGEVLQMAPIGNPHAVTVNRLNRVFSHRLYEWALVSVQNPVLLDDFSEPQPDLVLLRLRDDLYAENGPIPADVLLLVEVSDTTMDFDRKVKGPLYARSGISEYWLLDLMRGVLEVHRTPTATGYADIRRLRQGDRVAPLAFPDCELDVGFLLGLS